MCVSVCVFMCVCVFVFVCVCVCTRVCVRWKEKESRTVQLIEHMMQMIYMHYFMRWCIFVAVVSSHTGRFYKHCITVWLPVPQQNRLMNHKE